MRFEGLVYRSIDPGSPVDPLSGEGARTSGNRFNPKGVPALYTSLDVMTALRESARDTVRLQPCLLVSIEVAINPVFNATDGDLLAAHNVDLEQLAVENWREATDCSGTPVTQAFARTLLDDGYAGLLVPSFCPGSARSDRNLVLWRWDGDPLVRATLVDDEHRVAG